MPSSNRTAVSSGEAWTDADFRILKLAVQDRAPDTDTWSKIAELMPGRNKNACMKKWDWYLQTQKKKENAEKREAASAKRKRSDSPLDIKPNVKAKLRWKPIDTLVLSSDDDTDEEQHRRSKEKGQAKRDSNEKEKCKRRHKGADSDGSESDGLPNTPQAVAGPSGVNRDEMGELRLNKQRKRLSLKINEKKLGILEKQLDLSTSQDEIDIIEAKIAELT